MHPIFFLAQQNLPLQTNQHSDKDKEIHCHQLFSPAATSRCPVI
jgi:hypothetical protein